VQEYRSGGVAIFEQPPASMAALPDLGMRLTVAMADALADMHKVDWQAAGLSDLGKPEGFIERNMQNWRDRWRRASESNPVPLMESLGERLEKEMPKTQRFSIIHNDFKLNNCQFLGSNPDRVHSIFDWDMATVGDPFFDVGIALNYWASQTMSGKFTLPPKEVFAELYAARMNLYPSALRWYEAFGAWRSAITVQQLYNRYAQGQSSDERLKNLAGSVPRMAEAAAQIWRGA
jgi:aminoglycoside phosphotransferase (APT) family kinase protein